MECPVPCVAGQWFALDKDDKKIVRTLKLSGAAQEAGEPKMLRYKVVVKTSDVKGAGAQRLVC